MTKRKQKWGARFILGTGSSVLVVGVILGVILPRWKHALNVWPVRSHHQLLPILMAFVWAVTAIAVFIGMVVLIIYICDHWIPALWKAAKSE